MPRDQASTVAPHWPGPSAALCWREVVLSSLDGWHPGEMRVEGLLDWMERTR